MAEDPPPNFSFILAARIRVKVEDIAGVSLIAGRTTEKEGHSTVSNGLL